MNAPLLTRSHAAAPARIVHLGLGRFFRAHQAYYTDLAPDRDEWGIAAFAGRSAGLARELDEQGGLYTLITRDGAGDLLTVPASVVRAYPAAAHDAWLEHFAAPELACVTLTVTESGYVDVPSAIESGDGQLAADIATLRGDRRSVVTTVPARLVAGLAARCLVDGGPLTVISCDNLPANGTILQRMVHDTAALVDSALADWIAASVCFASTMVDRITPPTTSDDVDLVAATTGRRDECPVVTEPFTEWVIAGQFAAGRPGWPQAGVTLTDAIEPHERRKLWLLNGAHSLLAYTGLARGHRTVADAVADPVCAGWMRRWWAEALPGLQLTDDAGPAYCEQLVTRFANPRISYPLAQVATDGSKKLPVRIGPVLLAERAAGRLPAAALTTVAAWIAYVMRETDRLTDPKQAALAQLVAGPSIDFVPRVLDLLEPRLADDAEVVGWLRGEVGRWLVGGS